MVCGATSPLLLYSRMFSSSTKTWALKKSSTTLRLLYRRGASTASLPTRGGGNDDGTAAKSSTTASSSSDLPLYSHLIPDYQEWYIPVTRRSLISKLLVDDQFAGGSEKTRKNLKVVAAEIDVAVANKYHQVHIR